MTLYNCKCSPEVPCYGYGECQDIGGECRLTKNPDYSINGYCEDPENHPERFNREEISISADVKIIEYVERNDYVKPRCNI